MMRIKLLWTNVALVVVMLMGMQRQAIGQSLSQRGKDFWLVAPLSAISTSLVLDFSTGSEPATVTVSARTDTGTWIRVYKVPANSSVVSAQLPASLELATGSINEGTYHRYIHIQSDAPVACYSHFYGSTYSGGTLLLAEETWGYSYLSMDSPEDNGGYTCVLATHDNTKVEITPKQLSATGHAAGVPFTITLNKGDVYQLLNDVSVTGEITGTLVRSVSNDDDTCFPIAVYSGSSGHAIYGLTSDFLIQQLVPWESLGKKYLVAPFSSSRSLNGNISNPTVFRVLVKDPATVVKRNGVALTNLDLVDNLYYEFTTSQAEYIEADEPVMVFQFMISQNAQSGYQDPEMIALSPIEQGLKRVDFHRSYVIDIAYNYLTIIIPTAGLNSLTIDGSNTFGYTYPHPNKPGYSVVVQGWVASDKTCTVKSDSAFTAISYGLGSYESYGFNLVPLQSLTGFVRLHEKDGGGVLKEITCMHSPFQFVLKTEFTAERIEWNVKGITGLSPNADNILLLNPVPDSIVTENGRAYKFYSVPRYDTFTAAGVYTISVKVTSPVIDNCSHSQTFTGYLTAKQSPIADFSYTVNACSPFSTHFTAGAASDTSTLTTWHWNFEENSDAYTAAVTHTYVATGVQPVYLQVTALNGCVADTTKKINLQDSIRPLAAFQSPATVCLPYGGATFTNQSSYTGRAGGTVMYQWDFADGATSTQKSPVHYYRTGSTYKVVLIATAADGCSDTTDHPFSAFINRPKAAFDMPATELCVGGSLQFTDLSVAAAGSSVSSWSWLLDKDGSKMTEKNPFKQYNKPGAYTISHFVTSREGCLSDTAQQQLQINDIPIVEAGPDKFLQEGGSVRLDGVVRAEGNVTIQWTPAAHLSASDMATPLSTTPVDQLYYLTAATGSHCSDYDSVMVKILLNITPPNAFSPNGDGNHDVWDIPGLSSYAGAVVQVFNRWGQRVFESKGYAMPWNGTQQGGSPVPAGTYYYVINPGGGKPRQSGAVTIVR